MSLPSTIGRVRVISLVHSARGRRLSSNSRSQMETREKGFFSFTLSIAYHLDATIFSHRVSLMLDVTYLYGCRLFSNSVARMKNRKKGVFAFRLSVVYYLEITNRHSGLSRCDNVCSEVSLSFYRFLSNTGYVDIWIKDMRIHMLRSCFFASLCSHSVISNGKSDKKDFFRIIYPVTYHLLRDKVCSKV